MNLQIETWTGKLLYQLISDIAGMTKECLEMIYGEVKESAHERVGLCLQGHGHLFQCFESKLAYVFSFLGKVFCFSQ